ncbi:MAG: ABC transporter permease, partial [Planctomycetales bacterium]|nr:ABC transporter permease [Planctomycetales bacterium]
MDRRTLITRSLWHYRRSHLAVGLGVAVATAVITGALLIGGSVRSSLRDLVLERLGGVDYAILAQHPFREQLAGDLAERSQLSQHGGLATPALLLQASLAHRDAAGLSRRASGVTLLGITPDFGRFNTQNSEPEAPWAIGDNEAWLSPAIAEELKVGEGDEVLVRLPAIEAIPADSPLGDKSDTTVARRLKVARVLPRHGLARFSLAPTQREARNAFVSIATAQDAVDLRGKANAVLVGGEPTSSGAIAIRYLPALEDYGLSVHQLPDREVLQLESKQLVLSDKTVAEAEEAFGESPTQPIITYLANTLKLGDRQVPYSTICGVRSTAELGPLRFDNGEPIEIAPDEIVLNDWAAEALDASVGDEITVTYYQPESTHGTLVTAPPVRLKLKAIAKLAGPNGDPTLAADPRLTPVMEGVTDAESINDWDLPFELTEPISQADEDYWEAHSTTPKAFVNYSLAQRLWATRWGTVSLIRLPAEQLTAQQAAVKLISAIDPADHGLGVEPVKQLGLKASTGTTPFDGLFLGFSMFLIASAVMLIGLLYRLAIDQRTREVGVLAATGWTPRQVRRLLGWEGLLVARTGAGVGMLLGIGYAWLMLYGLRTVWVAAVVTPFLRLHVLENLPSLVLGFVLGLMSAGLTIWWTLRSLSKSPPRALLAGESSEDVALSPVGQSNGWLMLASFGLALALGLAAARQQGEAQAGLFFGSGALVLFALVLKSRELLRGGQHRTAAPARFGLASLAIRNVARRPGRSLLTIALVGAASYLILAISAFRLAPTESGTGGFELVAQSAQPLHFDLNSQDGLFEYAFSNAQIKQLQSASFTALRVHDGEDASCLNLFQTRQPRVLGAPPKMAGSFAWAATIEGTSQDKPFEALDLDLGVDSNNRKVVPVILDFNTAMYSLKLYGGVGDRLTVQDSAGRDVTLQVVGLLQNTILQGDLILSEANFLQLYPESGGYRFFLIDFPATSITADELSAMLEDQLSDYGFDTEPASTRLAGFLAVQNTYLSTFQSLGALGLLLGAVGVAVVQLRNVEQRRGELALLRAGGFSTGRVNHLVLLENLVLLAGGLAVGGAAAAVASARWW